MFTAEQILQAFILPGAIAAVVMLNAWRPWGKTTPNGYWAAPVGIGIGFSAGLLAFQRRPPLPPTSAEDWLFHLGWIVAVVGLIDALLHVPKLARWVLTLLLGTGLVYLLFAGGYVKYRKWSTADHLLWSASFGLAMTVGFVLLEWVAERVKGVAVPAVLWLAATGLAVYMMLAKSASYGHRSAVIAATLGGVAVIALWSGKVSLVRGGVLAFVLLFGGLLATCYAYPNEVVAWRLIVIAAAPIVGSLALLAPLKSWQRLTLAGVVMAAMLGAAIVPAARQFIHDEKAPSTGWDY